jgi:hypothetical protein
MPPQTRLTIAKPEIVAAFEGAASRVFTETDIRKVFNTNRGNWRLAQTLTLRRFIDFLLNETPLTMERLDFPQRKYVRYVWGEATTFDVIQSLRNVGYFTHFSAIQLHSLTEQVPKSFYFNVEQKLRGGDGVLTQAGIDQAFRRKPRVTNNIAEFRGMRIYMLNGKNTGRAGLQKFENLTVTNIERTLIDIVVRPMYSGGVTEVQKAYRLAAERVSVSRLIAMYRRLKYTYPYHQAIGFYLERAGGYKDSLVDWLRQFPMEFDFYLTYGMKEVDYVKEWRLFVPKGL